MKADKSADCAVSCGSCFRTELCFYFFLGPRNRKSHCKELGFRQGPDLAILSTVATSSARQKANFRLVDLSRLNELCLASSFDWPKGQ
jgi:hypothetical protein